MNNTVKKALMCLAGAIVLIVLLLWFNHHRNAAKPQATLEKPVLTVETVQPLTQNWSQNIRVNGTVAPWQEAVISAEISGLKIAKVLVDVGSAVRRGQDLVVLNDETVIANLHVQQAVVEKNRASLAEATSNADRARAIQDSGALSKQQINQYLIAEQTAKATLAESLATLETQQIYLKQTHIKAIDDGVISARSANLGNVINAGTELFKLVRQGRIEWRAEVNATQLTHIQPGQLVNLSLPNGNMVQGRVRVTSPTLDEKTLNALVYVDLPKGKALPGMYAQGEIEIGTQTALTVPNSAIVLRDGRSYVFEVKPDQHVVKHAVTLGRSVGNDVELLPDTALHQGVRLVASGGAFLSDGDLVSVAPQTEAGNQ